MSAYYALRLYQRTMHNRKPNGVLSREISLKDGLVLAPLVLIIVGLALCPQLILSRTDTTVEASVKAVARGDARQPGPGSAGRSLSASSDPSESKGAAG
jgi:NADH-quinone oxidoreductase subunit M